MPPIGTDDPNGLLMTAAAQAEFRRGEELVNDQHVIEDARVDDLGLTVRANHKDRRHLALNDAPRELDIDMPAVVIDRERPPGWIAAAEAIAIVARRRAW